MVTEAVKHRALLHFLHAFKPLNPNVEVWFPHMAEFHSAACPWQVGAAISMTYITSKPIVFVGTGQTYCDLRSLNAKAVVAALMKA